MQEFQAVILASGPGSALFPLTGPDAGPKALLPVANVPVVAYLLHSLAAAGLQNALIVCQPAHEAAFSRVLPQALAGLDGVRWELCTVPSNEAETELEGPAQALRQLCDRLTARSVLLLPCDLVSTVDLRDLLDAHRVNDAGASLLLREEFRGADSISGDSRALKEQRGRILALNKSVINYFGLVHARADDKGQRTEKVVMMRTLPEGDPVEVKKSLLMRHPKVRVHSNLYDAHVYILRRWMIDILCCETADDHIIARRGRAMSTIRTELLPFIVNQLAPNAHTPEVKDFLLNIAKNEKEQQDCRKTECFALITPPSVFSCRANTMYSYAMINHAVANVSRGAVVPWPRPPLSKYKQSVVGQSTEIAKTATVKNSVVGNHCRIEDGAAVSNSVVMNYCTIREGAVIQNSIIADHCIIGENCSLSEIQLEERCEVRPAGLVLKSQSILRSDLLSHHQQN